MTMKQTFISYLFGLQNRKISCPTFLVRNRPYDLSYCGFFLHCPLSCGTYVYALAKLHYMVFLDHVHNVEKNRFPRPGSKVMGRGSSFGLRLYAWKIIDPLHVLLQSLRREKKCSAMSKLVQLMSNCNTLRFVKSTIFHYRKSTSIRHFEQCDQ